MCDCTRLQQPQRQPLHVEAPSSANNNNDINSHIEEQQEDPFGFVQASQEGPLHQSLPVHHQFLLHAAMDRLEEMIDVTSTRSPADVAAAAAAASSSAAISRHHHHHHDSHNKIPSGMAVRKVPAKPTWGVHWLGLLESFGDSYRVYGHITATNIKFFALTQGNADPIKVRDFLNQVHSNYIAYVMNPFCPVRELDVIDSRRFDEGMRKAVYQYGQPREC